MLQHAFVTLLFQPSPSWNYEKNKKKNFKVFHTEFQTIFEVLYLWCFHILHNEKMYCLREENRLSLERQSGAQYVVLPQVHLYIKFCVFVIQTVSNDT